MSNYVSLWLSNINTIRGPYTLRLYDGECEDDVCVYILQRTAKKCTKNYNAHAQPLLCSLNDLFGDVFAAVALVF